MKHILVLQTLAEVGNLYQERFKMEGYRVTVSHWASDAMKLLQSEEQFDLVLSGALRWETCYNFAIRKYGLGKVIVYTSLGDVANQLSAQGVQVFVKDDRGHHPLALDAEGLVARIKRLVPPSD